MSSKKINRHPIVKGLVFFGLVLFTISLFSLPVKAGVFDDIRDSVSQAGSYFSEGEKTFSDASGKIGNSALNVWQKIGNGLGEAAGSVVKNTSQASSAFLGGIKNFGQTVGGLGNQVSKGYDATLGKVKQGTDKVAETVINVLPKKNVVKIAVPKQAVKKDIQKSEVKEDAATSASALITVQPEENKKQSAPIAPKEIIIYSNKANQKSVQPLVATVAKASSASGNSVFETIKSNGDISVGNDVKIDAATGIATLKGIKIIGTVDFTGADVKGFKQTVVNNYSGASTPLVVYNSSSGNYETRTSVSGNYGGVSEQFSVGKDLTVGQNATVASGLTIGATSANGSLTVNGAAAITGATTLSGAATLSSNLTVNGNTTLGDTAGDTITINGRLSTLNVSDGSTTSSLAKNSFYIAADSSNALGKFYVDLSGNVSASGTITSSGGITMSGHLNPSSDNLYDVGSSSTQWRYGNFQGGLLVADGSTTSTLLNNSLTLGQASGYNLGKFYIDSSGNVSASGTWQVTNTSTLYKDLLVGAASESIADAGFIFTGNDAYIEDQLGVNGTAWFDGSIRASSTLLATGAVTFYGNSTFGDAVGDTISLNGTINTTVRASSTLLVGTAAGTDNLFVNGNNTYVATSTAAGTAYSLVVGNGTTGAVIAGGHISPSHTGLFDLGRNGLGWNNLFTSSTIYTGAGGTSLSTLSPNILAFAGSTGVVSSTAGNLRLAADGANQLQMWTNGSQRAFIDSSGNTFASGTLQTTGSMLTYGNVTSTGIIYASGGLISSASSSFGSNVNVSGVLNASGTVYLGGNLLTGTGTGNSLDIGALNNAFRDVYASSSINVGNGANSSTFKGNYLALTNGTSSTVFNGSSLTLGQGTNYNSGMFNVNSNGNVNASGTIQLAKLGTSSAGVTTYNSPDINIQSSAWDTDGSEDTWQFKIRNAPSSAATTVGNLKFLVQKNANSEAMVFSADSAGAFTAVTSLNTNTGIVQSNNTLMIVKGWAADGGTSVGVALDAGTAFVNAGAKLVSIRNAGTEKAYFNASGTPAFGIQTGYNDGLFKIDTSGNVSATGSLKTFGNVTSTGNLYALTSTASTSILNGSSLTLGQGTAYNSGMFNVDSNGNVRTSGTTFQMYDPNSGQLSANFSIITSVGGPPGQNYASTTFNSLVYDSVGSTGFVFNTYVGGEGGAMTSGTTPGVPDTAAPAKALAVFQNNGTNKVIISAGGNVYAKNSFIANSTTYSIADMAEYVNLTTGETGEPGDVLVVDLAHPNQYKKSSSAYSKEIAGVISDTGAFLMGASGEGRAPLALAGLVKTKVTDENGPIAVGDYLVSASKPGYAMKYDSSSGKSAGLVGMALEPLANGDGKITIMVNKGLVAGSDSTASLTVGENGDGTLSGGEDWDVGGKNILNVKSISGANGLWYIDEKGFLMAKEIKADKVQAKKFVVEKETNLKKASVGEATISQNNSSITVENELITSKVKIFITFRSNPQSFWWISKQEDGKFEVSLSKVAEVDLTFDYWIVGVEDAPALETKSAPAASVAPIETPVVPVVESAPITPIVPDTASASTTVETPAPVAPVELAPTESASVSDEVPNP